MELGTGAQAARTETQLSFLFATSPIVFVVAANYLLSSIVFPSLDSGYLASSRIRSHHDGVGERHLGHHLRPGVGQLYLVAISAPLRAGLKRSLDDGANASVLPIFNTASLVGFGAVIASLPGFHSHPGCGAWRGPGKSAGFSGDCSQRTGRNNRVGFRRHEHSTSDSGRYLSRTGKTGRSKRRVAPPCYFCRHRWSRRIAAQWRRHHTVVHLQAEPSAILPGHFHGRCYRTNRRPDFSDIPGYSIWQPLKRSINWICRNGWISNLVKLCSNPHMA